MVAVMGYGSLYSLGTKICGPFLTCVTNGRNYSIILKTIFKILQIMICMTRKLLHHASVVSWIHSLHVYGKKLINFYTPLLSNFHIFHWVVCVLLYGLGQLHSCSQKDSEPVVHKSVHHKAILQLHDGNVTYNYECLGTKILLRGESMLR
jgi:hypothetical protein